MVVGARSAIFVPFDRLGLVIIDEEHEPTYKSRSHRNTLLLRWRQEGACTAVHCCSTGRRLLGRDILQGQGRKDRWP